MRYNLCHRNEDMHAIVVADFGTSPGCIFLV